MTILTFETYKKEILKRFFEIKKTEGNRYLYNPTPGNIKKQAKELIKEREQGLERQILSDFFKVSNKIEFLNYLDSKDAESFKSVQKFLLGKTKSPDEGLVEFAAWLVDFSPRPYNKYRKSENKVNEVGDKSKILVEDSKNRVSEGGKVLDKEKKELSEQKEIQKTVETNNDELIEDPKKPKKNVIGVFLLFLVMVSMFVWWRYFRLPECMIWKDDRYIKITCDLHNESNLDLWKLENFREVDVDKNTEFFDKNANPKIWYDKTGKEITFYNNPGIHPTNGKTLRPITETIIRKYVLPQE